MTRIFDNISEKLLPTLRATLQVSRRAHFCVGYLNLRSWQSSDDLVELWSPEQHQICRVLAGKTSAISDVSPTQAADCISKLLAANETRTLNFKRIGAELSHVAPTAETHKNSQQVRHVSSKGVYQSGKLFTQWRLASILSIWKLPVGRLSVRRVYWVRWQQRNCTFGLRNYLMPSQLLNWCRVARIHYRVIVRGSLPLIYTAAHDWCFARQTSHRLQKPTAPWIGQRSRV
jgi:hypothetical protein